ncbi:MAG: carboxypeptidase-like regulatory domain-containing protein [Vicinamibacterales bacterium]
MKFTKKVLGLGWIPIVLLAMVLPASAQTSATITGTVKDGQGGTVPGATVTLLSERRGTSQNTITAPTGDFTFSNVAGDTYTVRVTMDGFKTSERKGIAASPGDRVVVGTLTIEVGALAETVTVSGEAPIIQAQTGERSFTVTTESVANLPLSNRNFGGLAALTPGVIGTTRIGAPGSTTNYQIDGVSTIDTGAGGQALALNVDAIAEVKVVSSGYQAEYGRSIGLQVTGVTKSGTNRYRGSVYDIRRDSRWDSYSWAQKLNGDPKTFRRDQDWGYTIGGPIGKPGGQNTLFFFYGHEYRPRTSGGGTNRFRVPTLAERSGDFSSSKDNNGNQVFIKDPLISGTCSAANTTSCFKDNGVVNKIPQNRLYPIGINLLKLWPEPNETGQLSTNFVSVTPRDHRLTQQPTVRVDWQPSGRIRLSGKYAGQLATNRPTNGSIPGFNDSVNPHPTTAIYSGTLAYTLNPTTFFEGTYGWYQAYEQGSVTSTAAANRCNAGSGLCNFPLPYQPNGEGLPVPVGSFQEKILKDAKIPYYVDGKVYLLPSFSWGGKISNAPPNLLYNTGGFLDLVRTNNVALSLTRVMGRHSLKVGYQLDHSLKLQEQLNNPKPFQGTLNFGDGGNNPLDTQFGFSNAAVGVFQSYSQVDRLLEGNFIYNSHEWYIQDNWKTTNKLTLDYGLRITHQGENYDTKLQTANFFPDKWSPSAAPLLYKPGCAVALTPTGCPTASRVAVHPTTGASLGANTAVAIGAIVPNSGNKLNGIIAAGDGIAKENYKWPDIGFAPRFGAAYDLTGQQRYVVRGSVGVFFDRLNGNTVYNQVGNPPSANSTQLRNGQLQTIGQSGLVLQTPSTMTVFYYDSKLPTSYQWNVGMQMALPFTSSLDISYVGSHSSHILGSNPDLNAPDIGVAYLQQNQDPTLAVSANPGATAFTTDLLRPYRGLANINTTWGKNWNGYDSIQMSFNRRFRNGVQGTLNYTYSIRTIGNTNAQLRLQHNPDGTYQVRDDQKEYEKKLRDQGNRPHVIRGNFVWDLPDLKSDKALLRAVGWVANDWQLSGVLTATSGSTYDASFSYQGLGNVNLTGSPSYAARIRVVGDPGGGCSGNQYQQFNTAAFAGPNFGSDGLESGSGLMRGCFEHTTDLAIARNIRFWGSKEAQIRVELFNAFNEVVINGRNTSLTLNSPTNPTPLSGSSQYNADGTLNQARLTPRNAGFGAATGSQGPRTAQVQLRFNF